MKKILLACAGGFSTSMLVQQMQEAAKKQQINVLIEAMPEAEIKEDTNFDILMLGPQLGHVQPTFQARFPKLPVTVIDMVAYGMLDGTSVLATAMKIMEGNQDE